MNSCWKLAAVVGYALFGSLLISRASSADEPAARERGVWQKHEYSFVFMGFTSTYSCDGLADKLKLLLTAAGARPASTSQAGARAHGFRPPDERPPARSARGAGSAQWDIGSPIPALIHLV